MRSVKERHILVIRLSALGDVAIAAPLVKEYARQNPAAKFYMLSQPRYEPMFSGVENLFFVPIDTKRNSPAYCGGPRQLMRFANDTVKKYGITDVADIHNVLRTKIMRFAMWGHGVKCRVINKRFGQRRGLIRKNNKILKPLTASQRCMEEVLVSLGFTDIHFTSAGRPIEERLHLSTDVCKIGIAPFAGHAGKTWPLEKMEEVVRILSGSKKCDNENCSGDNTCKNRILLFGGGEKEVALLNSWAAKYPNTEVVAGKHTMVEELELMKNLNVMVSMDSANMHLASLEGTPVVSIWGATHPYAGYYGYRQNVNYAVQVDLPCRPCSIYGAKPCYKGNYECLEKVAPSMVVEKVEAVLKSGEKKS
jgi:ADP-heptose:LPS heptosyltransferase